MISILRLGAMLNNLGYDLAVKSGLMSELKTYATTPLWNVENNYWATPLKQHNYNQKCPGGDSNALHMV